MLNPWALLGVGAAFVAVAGWGALERDWRKGAEWNAAVQKGLATAALKLAADQAAETKTGNDYIAAAAKACGAELRAIDRGRAAGREVRNASPDRAVDAALDGMCRDRADNPACQAH